MRKIVIQSDEGDLRKVTDVADVAEATPGRLQVASTNGDTEIVEGTLFGAFGDWRVWLHATFPDDMSEYRAENPLTMPAGFIRMKHDHGYEDRVGTIKRLRQPNL